ncbi:hypothetical protein D3C78_1845700 [compost metagenome]
MQSGPPGTGKVSVTASVCRSMRLMELAVRLLTNRWRLSPCARNACAPAAVGMRLTSLAGPLLTS